MILFLIRHGETDWNRARRVQGREDIPLNKTGKTQSRRTAEAMRYTDLDAIFVSPLGRAKETAAAIASYHPDVPVIEDERLIERDFGMLSGTTIEEREWFFREGRTAHVEDEKAVFERAMDAMAAYFRYQPARFGQIAVVTHGGVLYHLIEHLQDQQTERFEAVKEDGTIMLYNCNISILRDDWKMLAINLSPDEFAASEYGKSGPAASEFARKH